MIIRPKPTVWDVLFTLKGSIAKHIALRLVTITAIACLVTMWAEIEPGAFAKLATAPFTESCPMKVLIACSLMLPFTTAAWAQDGRPAAPDHPIRDPYITSTGATVDKPGEPQSSGTTPLDRRIQRQGKTIDGGICSEC